MKITLLGSDLSGNEAGRLYLLGNVLKRRYEVEVVGLSSRSLESDVWPPVDTGELSFKPVPCIYRYPDVFRAAKKVLQLIEGDVLYAEGLSGTSYGIGLWHKQCKRKPLVLDNSDWDLGHFLMRNQWQRWGIFVRQLLYPNNYLSLLLMERLVGLADAVTGSNRFVVDRFNGVIVPHGKDTNVFDPALYDRFALRREWGVDQYKVLMFFGTPRRHKGLEELVAAVRLTDRTDVRLMLVGVGDYPVLMEQLEELGGKSLIFVSSQPFSSVPKFLSMADLVVIPQQDTPLARGQMPAKLYDAMAMARPIVSTPVSDIPETLEGCGYIARSGTPEDLAEAIAQALDHPEEAWELGRLSRQRCIERYSWDAMERTLVGVFEQFNTDCGPNLGCSQLFCCR